jgi:hypothetical protein
VAVGLTLVFGLAALALIDSTSIGTLVIPMWLLLAPDPPPVRRLLAYLGVIAGFYLTVGVALLLVARTGLDALAAAADHPVLLWVQLAVGVGLFALCWRYDSGRRRKRGEPDRAVRWRDRVLAADRSAAALLRLAVVAAALELLTMLPYLAAIGLLAAADLPAAASVPVLAGYCAVMVLPALALVGLRATLQSRLEPPLRRIETFMSRHADSAIGWTMGIAGFLVARDAAVRIWWPDSL